MERHPATEIKPSEFTEMDCMMVIGPAVHAPRIHDVTCNGRIIQEHDYEDGRKGILYEYLDARFNEESWYVHIHDEDDVLVNWCKVANPDNDTDRAFQLAHEQPTVSQIENQSQIIYRYDDPEKGYCEILYAYHDTCYAGIYENQRLVNWCRLRNPRKH